MPLGGERSQEQSQLPCNQPYVITITFLKHILRNRSNLQNAQFSSNKSIDGRLKSHHLSKSQVLPSRVNTVRVDKPKIFAKTVSKISTEINFVFKMFILSFVWPQCNEGILVLISIKSLCNIQGMTKVNYIN